ncbi:MAG: helix-turn-helix transcriptional regulator [Proteobacteria bacterium]|nr:helix-turn-helix domain-containing protein [Pseudomonadota bacterium]NOG60051.1 helix-turn-helix transcriptional regulator [Pseudomonadota bacterium]
MEKTLRIEAIKQAMDEAGLSRTALAKKLSVSREIVSQWLKGSKFPRPDKLLKLGLTLNLAFDDLISTVPDKFEPKIAFRKKGSAKTTEKHIKKAKEIGYLLEPLVSYLPYDEYVQPQALKNPVVEYGYIQEVAAKVRKEIGLNKTEEVDFDHLIKRFNKLQAVLVPVMWGKKDRHENALHIYLPKSMTTWVYINIDTEVHDFKFWMAHELGHVYSPELEGDEAEDFADSFAGALLFPERVAKETHKKLSKARSIKSRIAIIQEYAEEYIISMISVLYEVNKYATEYDLETFELGDELYKANARLHRGFKTVKEALFDSGLPSAENYIETVTDRFNTPFFNALKTYLVENGKSAGYIQCILDTPLLDAKELHAELS